MSRRYFWASWATIGIVLLTILVVPPLYSPTYKSARLTTVQTKVRQENPSSLSHIAAPAWVKQAEPYVHVVGYVASVDSNIYSSHLNDELIQQVVQSVHNYNMASLPLRRDGITVSTEYTYQKVGKSSQYAYQKVGNSSTQPKLPFNAQGCESASIQLRWYGVLLFTNHCLVGDIEFAEGSLSGASGIIAAFLGLGGQAVLAAIFAAIAGFLGVNLAYLNWADNHCGSRGVNWNITWVAVFWVTPIC